MKDGSAIVGYSIAVMILVAFGFLFMYEVETWLTAITILLQQIEIILAASYRP